MTTEFDTLTHATADERTGIAWWNSLGKAARLYWLRQAGSAVPADAWSEYKRTQSRIDWCRNDFPPSAARPTKINMRQARCGCAAGLSIGVGCRPAEYAALSLKRPASETLHTTSGDYNNSTAHMLVKPRSS
jgi:hypothetical protein